MLRIFCYAKCETELASVVITDLLILLHLSLTKKCKNTSCGIKQTNGK